MDTRWASLIAIILSVTLIAHIYSITQGHTNYLYERTRDIAISALAAGIGIHCAREALHAKKTDRREIIVACIMLAIITLHLCRFFYGGLPCSG